MNERTIEAKLKKAVEASGGLCWKLVCPGTTGVPDRICLMRNRAVFVE
ncbi:MAG: VRR-NUC domain-containing protein, partial [Actinomyces sp.]|nr:VRR-NUC domain-containing protein [Actinomyces sp.]